MQRYNISISAVIITYNEARNIGRCLDSLEGIVDDIIVLDSFSNDQTQHICQQKGARVFQHAFLNYSDQKNKANALALYDFILSVDADEALSEKLRLAIAAIKLNWTSNAYSMNRHTNYCGKWIYHSGWYPDKKIRLFDRRQARWGGPNPHEILELPAETIISELHGDLLHYSYYTVEEHYERAKKYAALATEAMREQGKTGSWLQAIFSPVFKFLRNYLLKLGFLDGYAGFTICRISALETWWKYRNLLK